MKAEMLTGSPPEWARAPVFYEGENGVVASPLVADADGAGCLQFTAAPGLYQFSVVADAGAFDWEALYFSLDQYGNHGVRTGPWDFDLRNGNRPLIPCYWVELDGERLGLWMFQRVSLEDLAAKRFRGRFAFRVKKGGVRTLRLTSYRPMALRWISARLEPDPEDRLLPPSSVPAKAKSPLPAMRWGDARFWIAVRETLCGSHALYAPALERSLDAVFRKSRHGPADILLLLARARLEDSSEALEAGVRAIDALLDLPHWGNPTEDGYGHDGDMGAAFVLRALAWAWHAYDDALGEERAGRLRAKLRLQGERFLTQALLSRDYWGGSVLQDHGWQSSFAFGTAALHLLGVLPEAAEWIAYLLPRINRAVQAMPRDGAIPPSSYGALYLYLDELTHFREAWLAVSGEDLFDTGPFQPILDYVSAVLDAEAGVMIGAGIQSRRWIGGGAFFNRLGSRFGDGRGAWFARRLLETEEGGFFHSSEANAYHTGVLHNLLSCDTRVASVVPVRKRLNWFEDSGLLHFHDPRSGVTFSMRCGPFNGYHAYRKATGPCDRMAGVPGAGHFMIDLDASPRLVTPDGGYRLHSFMRSCLLIDDQGQYGDIGYPMSIPSSQHCGEEIESAEWDDDMGSGRIRLHLGSAYSGKLGVINYTREFFIGTNRKIICRDHILLDRPRRLSWLFQGSREIGVALENGLCGRFGGEPALRLRPESGGLALNATVRETEIVWSYSSASGRKPFDHIRYDVTRPIAETIIDFVFTW